MIYRELIAFRLMLRTGTELKLEFIENQSGQPRHKREILVVSENSSAAGDAGSSRLKGISKF